MDPGSIPGVSTGSSFPLQIAGFWVFAAGTGERLRIGRFVVVLVVGGKDVGHRGGELVDVSVRLAAETCAVSAA